MEQKRGVLARIGIALLNLLTPGLGLLRIGRWKIAAVIYAAALLFLFFLNFAPPVGFAAFAVAALIGLATYPVSIVITWALSRHKEHPQRWYAKWYSIVGAMLLAFAASFLLSDLERVRYRAFYVPSASMEPSLPTGDRFFAYMHSPKELRRGDILLVRAPSGDTYVTRLAGLPGDEIAVANGIVILNGSPVAQQLIRSEMISDYAGTRTARRMNERFPGESGSHEIYDDGASMGDDFAPVRVRPGHVFLLGDNRDLAADSRFSGEDFGLNQLPSTKILGWPLFHSFGSSRAMGERINRKDMK